MSKIKFSQSCTFGAHLYRHKGEVAEIVFENTERGIRKTIVDNNGMICDFPGLAHPELVALYSRGYLGQQIRYRSSISKLGDHYALIWQIQPDGRYWEDEDGFGRTPDDEINLYARLDDEGKFIEPFFLYSIGSNTYYGTEQERNAALALSSKKDPLASLLEHVPELLSVMREKVMIPESGRAIYNIPGTVYQARLTMKTELDKWFVQVSMAKQGSDTSLLGWLEFLPLEEQRIYLSSERAITDAEEELKQLFYAIQRRD